MEIKNIKLKNFTVHKKAEFCLPERGLVFVSGDNGTGKTSLVEAVAYGLWGKTLRGTPTWSSDLRTECEVSTYSSLQTKRSRKGNTEKLNVSINGQDFSKDTKTKTQEVLEERCSSFDLWRKSHVFTREDSSYFACATDQERKKILETVLQLDRFDSALKKCKEDLSSSEEALERVDNKIFRLDVELEAKEDLRKSLSEASNPGTAPCSSQDISDLSAALSEEKESYLVFHNEYTGKDRALTELRVNVKALHKKAQDLRKGSCDSCGQGIEDSFRNEKLSSISQAVEEVTRQGKELALLQKECLAKRQASEKRGASLREKLSLLEVDLRVYQAGVSLHASASLKEEQTSKLVEVAKGERLLLMSNRKRLEEEVQVLQTCKKVLGLKGVRSHIFSALLSAVESLANSWLDAIDASFKIALSSYTANKTGGIRDAIDIKVSGLGHPHGYKGCSSGERRRINIALLLALGEVARGLISGEGSSCGGTIFFDEAFAGLDAKGKDLVTHSLRELSKDRCVVIIEHEWSCLQDVKPEMRINLKRKTQ